MGIVHAAVLQNVVHVPLSVTLGEALQVLESKIQSYCFRIQHPESMLPVVKTHTKVKMVEEQKLLKQDELKWIFFNQFSLF